MDPTFAAVLGLMPIAEYEREQELRRPLSPDENQWVDEALMNVWGMLGTLNGVISSSDDTCDHVVIDDQRVNVNNEDPGQREVITDDVEQSNNAHDNEFDNIIPMNVEFDMASYDIYDHVMVEDQGVNVNNADAWQLVDSTDGVDLSDNALDNEFDDITPMNVEFDMATVDSCDHGMIDDLSVNENNADAWQLEDIAGDVDQSDSALDDEFGDIIPMNLEFDIAADDSYDHGMVDDQCVDVNNADVWQREDSTDGVQLSDNKLDNIFDEIKPMNVDLDIATVTSFPDVDLDLLNATAAWIDVDISSYLTDMEQVSEASYGPVNTLYREQ